MSERQTVMVDGNEAAASVAYRLNEVAAIYPITPSSPMGELSERRRWPSRRLRLRFDWLEALRRLDPLVWLELLTSSTLMLLFILLRRLRTSRRDTCIEEAM